LWLHAGDARAATLDPPLVTTRDLWLGLGAAGATALVAANDGWFRDRALEVDSRGARSLARAAQPLGNPGVVAPALLLTYVTARLARREPLEHATLRTGISVGVAGGAALLVKEIVGRDRPSEAPGDPDRFHPFSGHDSFPSGHAVVAFATATALTRETRSRWVPWVAYPAAALVGWSRVHDDLHWTSDVVAGAALGIFLSAKTEDFLARRHFAALGLSVEPHGVGWRVAIELARAAPRCGGATRSAPGA